jgi:hypothetical protein
MERCANGYCDHSQRFGLPPPVSAVVIRQRELKFLLDHDASKVAPVAGKRDGCIKLAPELRERIGNFIAVIGS